MSVLSQSRCLHKVIHVTTDQAQVTGFQSWWRSSRWIRWADDDQKVVIFSWLTVLHLVKPSTSSVWKSYPFFWGPLLESSTLIEQKSWPIYSYSLRPSYDGPPIRGVGGPQRSYHNRNACMGWTTWLPTNRCRFPVSMVQQPLDKLSWLSKLVVHFSWLVFLRLIKPSTPLVKKATLFSRPTWAHWIESWAPIGRKSWPI